jgi:hypothetical protein
MFDRPCTLVVTVKIVPEAAKEFAEWYENKHKPDLLSVPGIRSARIMCDAAGLQFVSIYDLESENCLNSAEIAAVRGWGRFADRVSDMQRFVVAPPRLGA